MSEHRRKAIEAILQRKAGMTQARREQVNAHFLASADLYTFCRRCKTKRVGTLADLQKPCGCADEAS